jgi:hypothetical protein
MANPSIVIQQNNIMTHGNVDVTQYGNNYHTTNNTNNTLAPRNNVE